MVLWGTISEWFFSRWWFFAEPQSPLKNHLKNLIVLCSSSSLSLHSSVSLTFFLTPQKEDDNCCISALCEGSCGHVRIHIWRFYICLFLNIKLGLWEQSALFFSFLLRLLHLLLLLLVFACWWEPHHNIEWSYFKSPVLTDQPLWAGFSPINKNNRIY